MTVYKRRDLPGLLKNIAQGQASQLYLIFGERYLGGRVAFTSDDPEGTTFTISLPKVPLDRNAPRTAK